MNDTINYEILAIGQKTSDIFLFGVSLIIKIFGIITNIINIVIFSDSNFANQIYIFLRLHSVVDVFYLINISICDHAFVKYYLPVKFVKSFFIQLTGLYLCNYLTSSLAIFNILIELLVSIQRFLILINAKYFILTKKKAAYIIIAVVFLTSLIVYLQEIIFFQVMPIDALHKTNETNELVLYRIGKNSFGLKHGKIYENIAISVQIFRGPVCLIMMVLINSMTWYQFRKYLNKKIEMKRSKHVTYSQYQI
jgi:hypothetical protein